MLRNIIFSWDFCYFNDISDKVTTDGDVIMHDDITYMKTSSLIYCGDYLLFFVAETQYNSQNFRILQYYLYFIIQELMKIANAVYFEKQQKKQ